MDQPVGNSAGFSLIEAVVVSGVMAIIMLGALSMFELSAKQQKQVMQAFDAQGVASLVQLDFMTAAACQMTLQNLTFPAAPAAGFTLAVPQVKTASGTVIAAVAPATPNVFNSVALTPVPGKAGPIPPLYLSNLTPNGPTNYTANFNVIATPVVASIGANHFTRSFPVSLSVTLAGGTATITGCGGTGQTQTQKVVATCQTGGNTYDSCTTPFTWNTPFADNNYNVTCTGSIPNGGDSGSHMNSAFVYVDLASKTQYGFNLVVQSNEGNWVSFPEVDCIGIHP